jgi:mono/diheme cytochrome c family protein
MRLRNLIQGGMALAALLPACLYGQSATKPQTSIANRPWPAPVATTEPDRPPALSPTDALKTFFMAPGYHLELVAAEPLVSDPIIAEFDGDGRLWVLELHGFAYNDRMENSFEPINDLVVIEDSDGDGVYDKRTVFLDKLIMPRAFKVLDRNCALVGEPPNLWKACDNNGDLKSDSKQLLEKTFSTQGVVEHGATGLYWGMDNRIYVSEHTWNLGYDEGKFTTQPTLNRGQWGVTQDDAGRIYRNVNTDPLFVDYVAAHYYARNPNLVRTEGLYKSLVNQRGTNIWPVHPTMGFNRGYRADLYRPDSTPSYYQAVSSPMIYRGDALPAELRGQPFVVDSATNIVHLLRQKNDAGNLAASDYYEKGEFLASTDVRFRPVWLTPGWDGSFLVIDMYRGVSQDGPLQTDYLRDYIVKRELQKHVNLGRIYRVVHAGMPTGRKPAMGREAPAQLVAHLGNANGWWRDTAQQLLVQRNDKSVAPALRKLALEAPDWRTRLQALWTLDGLKSIDQPTVLKALDDKSIEVRAAGVRLSERWLREGGPVRAAVLKKMEEPNWHLRRQLAASLGEMAAEDRFEPLVTLLERYGSDPVTADIALSGLSGQESKVFARLLPHPGTRAELITVLAGAASKGREADQVQTLMSLAADPRQRAALRVAILQGMALGLQGGDGGGGNAVEGGRAGAAVPGMAPQPRRRRTGPLELTSAPTGMIELAARTGPVAEAARPVLELLNWPGKPAAPVAEPLTAEDQKRFNTGKALYAVNCVGCHLPEGQGQAKLGAPLAGSKLVNGPDNVVVRVLLNGKEGPNGLMPPAGAVMSDDDVAAVSTFVRRSWGNTGTPVVPPLVKEMRGAYAHRKTPWTDAELAQRAR